MIDIAEENAKIKQARIQAVNQITVAGNFFQMLKDIEAVGSDLEMMQSIGAPTTLIKSLKVAG